MKKLSVLIALMLVLTVGGVYATWSYAGTDDIADARAEAKVTIADVELKGANGTYAVTSNLVLSVDQANEDHEAELVFDSNNGQAIYLKVTFTPSANAPQDIKDNGIDSALHFGVTTPMQYKMDAEGNYSETGTAKDIFTLSPAENHGGAFTKNINWTAEDDGTFTYTMNEAALRDAIKLSQTFVLDTKTEYDKFAAAMAGNIVAHVTDGKTTT
jgi:hypothetical protein